MKRNQKSCLRKRRLFYFFFIGQWRYFDLPISASLDHSLTYMPGAITYLYWFSENGSHKNSTDLFENGHLAKAFTAVISQGREHAEAVFLYFGKEENLPHVTALRDSNPQRLQAVATFLRYFTALTIYFLCWIIVTSTIATDWESRLLSCEAIKGRNTRYVITCN